VNSRPETTLRVLHVTEAAAGGVRRHLGYIIPALHAAGVRQSVVVSLQRAEAGMADDLAAWSALGCAVHVLPMRHGLSARDIPHALALRRLVRQASPGVVHAHATKAGFLARLAVPQSVPIAYSPHSFAFQEFTGLKRALAVTMERLLARRTTRFVLVSQAERSVAEAELELPAERLRVVENGLPDAWSAALLPRPQVRAQWQVGEGTKVAVVPARLARQKGHDWLFRALALLGPMGDSLQVRLLGAGPERERLQRLAEELGITRLLHWDGYVPHAGRLLRGADLAILPSRHEGLSYALLEAAVAGVPLLVSDIPGNVPHPDMRQFLAAVPVDDVPSLATALRGFLSGDPDGRWIRAAQGPAIMREHGSLDKQTERLLTCYREIIG